MFVPGVPFQPSLMFVSKTGVHPSGATYRTLFIMTLLITLVNSRVHICFFNCYMVKSFLYVKSVLSNVIKSNVASTKCYM
jgi:hypothetical protein